MVQAETKKGLDVKQAFEQLLDNPNCKLNDIKVLRHRMNNDKISLDKMIELLTSNGYKCIQDQRFVKA